MPLSLALSLVALKEKLAAARAVVLTTPAELEEIAALVELRLVPCSDVRQAELLRTADALIRIWTEYVALRALVLGDVEMPRAVPAPRPFLQPYPRPMGATPPIPTPAAPAAEV
jgi:hypothetical protein